MRREAQKAQKAKEMEGKLSGAREECARWQGEALKAKKMVGKLSGAHEECAWLRKALQEMKQERDQLIVQQQQSRGQGPKERRAAVLRLLAKGTLSDRAIAREVGVAPTTVGNLRRAHFEKTSEA